MTKALLLLQQALGELSMLAGRFPSDEAAALRPYIDNCRHDIQEAIDEIKTQVEGVS